MSTTPSQIFQAVNTVEDSGSAEPQRPIINFVGATIEDDPSNNRTNITIDSTVSIPSTQIAFGSNTNTITGSSNLIWNDSTKTMSGSGILQLTGGGASSTSLLLSADIASLGGNTNKISSIAADFTGDIALIIDTSDTWTSNELVRINNNGIEVFGFESDGKIILASAAASPLAGALQFDGYHMQICNDGSNWQDIATPIPFKPFFSNSNWASIIRTNVGVAAGAYTTGAIFALDSNSTIFGARWYHQTGMTQDVKVTLWIAGTSTTLATITITPTPDAINTALFSSPYSYTVQDIKLAITVYDGINQILYMGGASTDPAADNANSLWGPSLWLFGSGYGAGDTGSLSAGHYNGIEPIYSVP